MRVVVTLFLLLALTGPSIAQVYPALTGRVVDQADLLPPDVEKQVTAASAALERRTGHQFVVATVPSLGGRSIEAYSLGLFRHWRIGRVGADDGVGLLVAPNERKVQIEVGRGLERALTNAEASRILTTRILPSFREGRMATGIERGARAIIAEVSR